MRSDSEAEKSGLKEKEKKKELALAPIAKPLAGKKLCKRILKLIRRVMLYMRVLLSFCFSFMANMSLFWLQQLLNTKCLRRGVKEVVKSIRRGNKRLCVIAGNISPIDVITHVPILREEDDIPYVYVPGKEDLASAGASKRRPTCSDLVQTKPTKGELDQGEQEKLESDYDQVVSDVTELTSLF